MAFPNYIYVFAAITNLTLRFSWAANRVPQVINHLTHFLSKSSWFFRTNSAKIRFFFQNQGQTCPSETSFFNLFLDVIMFFIFHLFFQLLRFLSILNPQILWYCKSWLNDNNTTMILTIIRYLIRKLFYDYLYF